MKETSVELSYVVRERNPKLGKTAKLRTSGWPGSRNFHTEPTSQSYLLGHPALGTVRLVSEVVCPCIAQERCLVHLRSLAHFLQCGKQCQGNVNEHMILERTFGQNNCEDCV